MARATHLFVCQACGTSYPKWQGKCEGCNAWNSLVEEVVAATPTTGLHQSQAATSRARRSPRLEFVDLAAPSEVTPRWASQNGEFDRVTGGGLVPGSAILIGGDPGIGKSTLLLQIAAQMAVAGHNVAYISGEESIEQIRMRAQRLGYAKAPLGLAAATMLGDILPALDQPRPTRGKTALPLDREHDPQSGPDLVIIDSIQTMFSDQLDSAPGTVGQVRYCAQELIRIAKKRGFVIVLVGHVTKEGAIAGPRVLEHMVDAVLYFEGDRGHHFRILRAVKNRFGPSDEIGVFEMTGQGLAEIANPSALFLGHRSEDGLDAVSGTAIFAGMEGTRPLLVEIQALVAEGSPGSPRRAVVGWDSQRLAMIIAVLETRCGIRLAHKDIYLNVAGGLRISEPAADLAVAAALVSALSNLSLPVTSVVFGEIGLGGEVRPVAHSDARLKEAERLGFEAALMPRPMAGREETAFTCNLRQSRIQLLTELVGWVGADA